jgi:hypothetical protein
MVQYKDYVAGWFASSIHEFIRVFPLDSKKLKYALISCLDSESNVVSLLKSSRDHGSLTNYGQTVGKGLLVPTKRLLEIDSGNPLFFGFDEIWFFPRDRIQPKPESTWLVGPQRITQEGMNALGSWVVGSACSLALGDGVGLNFIIKARGLVGHMLSFSMGQPEPTLRHAHTFEEQPWNPELVDDQ